jgi:hypothetical protein
MNPIEIEFQAEKCKFCKNKATKYCDIIGGHYAGHPPRVDGEILNIPMTITCDNPICDSCAIHLNEYMDICPDCYNDILKAKNKKATR